MYNKCVTNKELIGSQYTSIWKIEYLKLYQKVIAVVEDMIGQLIHHDESESTGVPRYHN